MREEATLNDRTYQHPLMLCLHKTFDSFAYLITHLVTRIGPFLIFPVK